MATKKAAAKKSNGGTATQHKHVKRTARKKERACQVQGCKNEYRAKGYCDEHYREWKSGAFGRSRYESCAKEGCNKPMTKEGLCETHWKEKRKPGEGAAAAAPAAPETPAAPESAPAAG